MKPEHIMLSGTHVRLEPLTRQHAEGLAAASAADPALYQWSPVPQGADATIAYIDTALAWREAGTAVPFAIIRLHDEAIIGSTRLWNLERWTWPAMHPRHGCGHIDGCEIGYTWLNASAIRSAVNTEAKLLLLTHAFEAWNALRVCFHTDARNQRSSAALQRIGGKFEGMLRSHRLAADYTARDSLRYSILADEWPNAKQRLQQLLAPAAPRS